MIVPRYPLTDFLFAHMHELEDVKIIEHPLRPRRWFDNLLRSAEVYLLPWWKGSLFFDEAFTAQFTDIRPEDTVLFFAVENRKDLQIMRKFIRTSRQHVWLWNPIATYRGGALSRRWYLHWLRRSGMHAYTFDPADAREGGIRLVRQVYRHVTAEELADGPGDAAPVDVYFLGIDKGRLPALRQLQAGFERDGLTTRFHVIADKRESYSDDDSAWLSPQWLSYRENLRQVVRSRALLELLQSSGSGPTIRCLEAAFLGRKLITDNRTMRHSDLYHPSRIFILGEDDLAGLKAFLDAPLLPVDERVLEGYDLAHWIRQFGDAPERSGSAEVPAACRA